MRGRRVAIRVEHEVLGLQITINDLLFVQIFEREDDACSHEPRRLLVEAFVLLQHRPHVSAQTRLHQVVEELSVLERLVQSDLRSMSWPEDDVGRREAINK
jgi:hypothetical protein